jgi:hypothetical protein
MWRYALLALVVPSVALGGFRSSSFKKETRLGADYWNVASALDGNLETCWMIDPEAESVGQWVEIDLPKSEVDKLAVVTGWSKDDSVFSDYGHLKSVRVELFTKADAQDMEGTRVLEHTLTFEDKAGWQVVDMPDTAVGSEFFGGRMRMTVTEVYEGQDYPYLAVSEVLVHLKEMDAKAAFRNEPTNSSDDHPADMMVDGNAKTYWMSSDDGAGTTFQVGADGFGLARLGIVPGPTSHARPKTVKIIAADVERTVTLADSTETQWIQLPSVIGYTGSAWGIVDVTVVDTYPGKSSSQLAIGDLELKATNYEGL